VIIFI